MFTEFASRVVAAVAPKATAHAYYICTYGSEYCRGNMRYIWQCCGDCPTDDPSMCDMPDCGYVDWGPC